MRRYGMSYWMDRLDPGRRRILLISPRGPLYRNRTGIWKKSLRYAPLTLTTLAALVPEELDAEVVVVDEGIHDIDWDAEADIVGISAITGTAPRSYELADHFRKRGVPVVLGGVHPTLVPSEAARHADSVVVGYAEETWPQLLRDHFSGDGMKKMYVQGHDLTLRGGRSRRERCFLARSTRRRTPSRRRGAASTAASSVWCLQRGASRCRSPSRRLSRT